MELEKRSAVCPVCKRTVQICVPAGGDGSVDVFMRHGNSEGVCRGSRQNVEPRRRPIPQATPAAMAERRARAELEQTLMHKHAGHDEIRAKIRPRTNPHE